MCILAINTKYQSVELFASKNTQESSIIFNKNSLNLSVVVVTTIINFAEIYPIVKKRLLYYPITLCLSKFEEKCQEPRKSNTILCSSLFRTPYAVNQGICHIDDNAIFRMHRVAMSFLKTNPDASSNLGTSSSQKTDG